MDTHSILTSIASFFRLPMIGGSQDGRERPDRTQHDNVSRMMDVDTLHAYMMEAEQGNPTNLFATIRDSIFADSHLLTEFGKRKIAVIGDELTVTPTDKTDQQSVWVADQCRTLITGLRAKWPEMLIHLLDGTICPVAVSMPVWRPSAREGWYYEIAHFVNVPLTSLDYQTGELRIRAETNDFIEPGPYNAIIHRGHILSNYPDYWGGPIRSILFWWLFAAMDRDWWVQFINKWGQPFLKGKYDPSESGARQQMESAFGRARKLFGIVMSKNSEVEVAQIASTSADVFIGFKNFANAEISKLILGQTMSATAENVGLGGGQATVQEEVRQDIRQYDQMMLTYTLEESVLSKFCQLNGWSTDLVPRIIFGSISNADKKSLADLLGSLKSAGLEVDDDALEPLSEQVGFSLRRAEVPSPSMGGYPFSASVPADRPRIARAPGAGAARRTTEEAALSANNTLIASSLDSYRAALGHQYKPIRDALIQSTSKSDFLRRLANLNLQPDPKVVDILSKVMTSASVNAAIASQPKI